jgi:2-dehydro-3-deoxygalactonokinase
MTAATPALIGIDWGTSSLRGTLLAADGTVLARHAAPRGLLSVPAGGWPAVFEAEFGAWRSAHPTMPVLLCGMVGSRQGWAEAPYCPCPAGAADLAAALHWLQPGRIAIVPGVCSDAPGQAPDVMRGEETQVIGALALQRRRDATLLLPGTHSKWVTAQDGRITALTTHLTGECFALLRQHSVLARTLAAEADVAFVPEAFDAGVAQARQPGGLLHHLFSVRSLALFDRLDPQAGVSRLSGLLIGEELRAQSNTATGLPRPGQPPLLLVGEPGLAMRYQRALGHWDVPVASGGDDATWHGLATLAGTLRTR